MTDGGWSDTRIEAALATLVDALVVPEGPPAALARPAGRDRRLLAAVAATVIAVAAGVTAAVPPARDAVAGWLGLRSVTLERVALEAAGDPRPLPGFADGVRVIDVATALADTGLADAALARAGLGRPDRAGRPPEGGVVLAWDVASTTLWIRPAAAGRDAPVIKRLTAEGRAEPIPDLGDAALYIDGEHVLSTPARTVAAGRVVWWLVEDVEHRLEGDRRRDELISIARALTP